MPFDLKSLNMLYVFLGTAAFSLIFILVLIVAMVRKKPAKTTSKKSVEEKPGTTLVRKLTSLKGPLTVELNRAISEADTEALAQVILHHQKYPESIKDKVFELVMSKDAVPKFIQNLQHVNFRVRAQSAEVLGILGSPQAVQPLLLVMQDRNDEVRLEVARALGKLKGQQVVEPLVEALKEPAKYVPARVAEVLISLGSHSVPALIGELLNRETDKQTRGFICEILGEIKDSRAVNPLIEALDDKHPEVRAKAAEALGVLANAEAVDGLVCSLEDPVWTVRVQAAKALGAVRSPEAIEFLARALEDKQWGVKVSAAEALAKIGGQGLVILSRIAESKEHPVAERAAALLKGKM